MDGMATSSYVLPPTKDLHEMLREIDERPCRLWLFPTVKREEKRETSLSAFVPPDKNGWKTNCSCRLVLVIALSLSLSLYTVGIIQVSRELAANLGGRTPPLWVASSLHFWLDDNDCDAHVWWARLPYFRSPSYALEYFAILVGQQGLSLPFRRYLRHPVLLFLSSFDGHKNFVDLLSILRRLVGCENGSSRRYIHLEAGGYRSKIKIKKKKVGPFSFHFRATKKKKKKPAGAVFVAGVTDGFGSWSCRQLMTAVRSDARRRRRTRPPHTVNQVVRFCCLLERINISSSWWFLRLGKRHGNVHTAVEIYITRQTEGNVQKPMRPPYNLFYLLDMVAHFIPLKRRKKKRRIFSSRSASSSRFFSSCLSLCWCVLSKGVLVNLLPIDTL